MAHEVHRLTDTDRTFIINAVRHRLIETHLEAIEDPRDALDVAQVVLEHLQAHIAVLKIRISNLPDQP